MYKYFLIFISLIYATLSFAQILPPKEASPLNVKQIHSGHSLTDPLFNPWPGQYRYLVDDILGGSFDNLGKSTIPGSSMDFRWQNAPGYGDPDARHDIVEWELLSITERVPLFYEGGNSQEWYLEGLQAQKENLSLFANNAWNNGNDGNGAPTLLWTTWTNIDDSDGPWREMLDIQGMEWEKMQDYANENRANGAPPVYIIPGHKMMARIYDDIQLNLVPDITDISQFFSDNIHLNELGQYAVAMIHYACIYNTSPVGLTHILLPDSPIRSPSPALATYLQTIVWDEVINYSRTGIDPTATSITTMGKENDFSIYPNPVRDLLYVKSKNNSSATNLEFTVFNSIGETVIQGNSSIINIQELPVGGYFIEVGNQLMKFIKI